MWSVARGNRLSSSTRARSPKVRCRETAQTRMEYITHAVDREIFIGTLTTEIKKELVQHQTSTDNATLHVCRSDKNNICENLTDTRTYIFFSSKNFLTYSTYVHRACCVGQHGCIRTSKKRSTTGQLLGYEMVSMAMPSLAPSSCSHWKTCSLK